MNTNTQRKQRITHLSIQKLLVVGDRLLFVHSQHLAVEARRLGLEDVDDVAIGPPVKGEVLDETVFWWFNLRR